MFLHRDLPDVPQKLQSRKTERHPDSYAQNDEYAAYVGQAQFVGVLFFIAFLQQERN